MRPLVAITTTVVTEAGPYHRPQIALYAVYVKSIEEYGLSSVLLTPAHAQASFPALLDHCHGLILTGGEDVDPALYGEEPMPGLGLVNRARDDAELEILRLATERELPILAICRGLQLMNVFCGGTLYQDLTLQHPSAIRHVQKEPWERRTHPAKVVAGSELAGIVEVEDLLINSFHHQAIKTIAPNLKASAIAEDGTIEAVEAPDYPAWLLGVQWHPERQEATAPDTDPDRRILTAFGRAVAERAEGR